MKSIIPGLPRSPPEHLAVRRENGHLHLQQEVEVVGGAARGTATGPSRGRREGKVVPELLSDLLGGSPGDQRLFHGKGW
jgi:hypothetical protein